jgi:hypothetical protein
MNYLMIELKDKRKFITNKKNLSNLIEFSKTFNADLSIISTESKNSLSLEQLANEICDTNRKQEEFKYKTIETLNKKETNQSNLIFSHIIKTLQSKKEIDTNKLIAKFKKKGIDEKNIYSQITKAKNYIKNIGKTLKRLGKTKYKIDYSSISESISSSIPS